jgi:hypothetical protein
METGAIRPYLQKLRRATTSTLGYTQNIFYKLPGHVGNGVRSMASAKELLAGVTLGATSYLSFNTLNEIVMKTDVKAANLLAYYCVDLATFVAGTLLVTHFTVRKIRGE